MAFTIPDKGEGDNDIQSILFQEDLDIVVAGVSGIDCVLSGLVVTGGTDMTPAVAKGAVLSNRIMYAVAAADVTITTADATNPRIDLIVVNSSGALAVRAGTPAVAPKPPIRTANDVVIAFVYVPANDTAIATTQITDKRVFSALPVIIYRTTTAETTNNTAAIINILNKTNSGIVIPDGLLTTGRILRVRIGGNCLINFGTPTIRIAVIFGAVTMYDDTSAAGGADNDRDTWHIDFNLVAQGNADQSVNGIWIFNTLGAGTAPTVGFGDIWGPTQSNGAFSGAGTANADTANLTLQVQWTYDVVSVNNEVVVEYATVELL